MWCPSEHGSLSYYQILPTIERKPSWWDAPVNITKNFFYLVSAAKDIEFSLPKPARELFLAKDETSLPCKCDKAKEDTRGRGCKQM